VKLAWELLSQLTFKILLGLAFKVWRSQVVLLAMILGEMGSCSADTMKRAMYFA